MNSASCTRLLYCMCGSYFRERVALLPLGLIALILDRIPIISRELGEIHEQSLEKGPRETWRNRRWSFELDGWGFPSSPLDCHRRHYRRSRWRVSVCLCFLFATGRQQGQLSAAIFPCLFIVVAVGCETFVILSHANRA